MIAIQKIGKSFSGALKYNFKKLNHPDVNRRAVVLGTNFASLDAAVINKEVGFIKSLRPNLNRYVYHTSLNFLKEEQGKLSDEKLLTIALDYLEASGFSDNQYIVFRHNDTDHPHIHLLVNRICFDGSVVSDSNNYKKSEAIIRALEYRYNLTSVEQCNFVAVEQNINLSLEQGSNVNRKQYIRVTKQRYNPVSRKYPTRDEVAMINRTGKSSNKLLLQELIKHVIAERPSSIAEFIRAGEKLGVYFLFNQASTGRVSGITYFFKDFKAKGQALGEQFKWAELIKKVDYDQERDHDAISNANTKTKTIYGELTHAASQSNGLMNGEDFYRGGSERTDDYKKQEFDFGKIAVEEQSMKDDLSKIITEPDNIPVNSADRVYNEFDVDINIQIADDIDDEAIHGRNRHRKKQARTNAR